MDLQWEKTVIKTANRASLALIMAMILWSTSFVALKFSFNIYDPSFVIFCRLTAAFIILLPFAKKMFTGNIRRRGDIFLLILMSLFEPCLYFIFESMALQNTASSQAAIITAMLPLLVAVTAAFILKESLSPLTITGFVAASAGAALLGLFSETGSSFPNPVLGNFFEFLAMVCATGYTITLRVLSPRYNPLFLTMFQSLTGALFFLPIIIFKKGALPGAFSAEAFGAILYMGLFVSVAAYGLYNYGIGKVKAAKGAAYINLIPVFSLFWGWFFLNEVLNRNQILACMLIITGLLLSQYRGKLLFSKPMRIKADS